MRRLVKSSKFNKGFSLIEVLVAIVVITLISIPLLRTFVTSATINTKAKKLQNATDIAQNVSESFATVPLLTLTQNNKDNRDLCGEILLNNDQIIVFKNIGDGSKDENNIPYFKGNDGEKFYVTVTMSPDEYSKNSSVTGVQDINNYIVPEMGDLFSTDVVTAYSQFTKYDNRIKTAFKNKYPKEDIFKSTDFDYDDIKKDSYVYIEQYESGEKVKYEYRLKVLYTYCEVHTTDYVPTEFCVEYNFTLETGEVTKSVTEKMPELYILYTPFDRYDTVCTYTFARDELHIEYMMNGSVITGVAPDWEKETKVFIIEQNVKNVANVAKGLNKDYVYLAHHKGISEKAIGNYGTGTKCDKLQIYSTINGWPMNVTAGKDHLLELYEMNVYVWYNQPDPNELDDYVNGVNNTDDVYTAVESIKEE